MKMYKTDLHVHTCLSPCARLDMSPKYILKQSQKEKIDILGICDHNSAENVLAVKQHARTQDPDVIVLGGIEISSCEEVHILGLFDDESNLFAMQKIVYDNLSGCNDEKRFGEQIVVNEKDEILYFNQKLLIGSTSLTSEEIVNFIHQFDGISVACHIDREAHSIINQLGFIPDDIYLDAVEISTIENKSDFDYLTLPVITSSDAHSIDQIGRSVTWFWMKEPRLEEVKKSLRGEDGRRVILKL